MLAARSHSVSGPRPRFASFLAPADAPGACPVHDGCGQSAMIRRHAISGMNGHDRLDLTKAAGGARHVPTPNDGVHIVGVACDDPDEFF